MENRHGLVVGATLTPATGTAEREAAIKMIVRRSPGARRLTLGADKGYDTKNFVADLRELNIAPHVAQNTTNRASAIDGRTTRHPGYAVSQIIRKRIEEGFASTKDDRRTAQNQTQGCRSRRVPVRLCNGSLRWPRLSEQFFRVDKWSACRG